MSLKIPVIKLDDIPQRLILNEHTMSLTTLRIEEIAKGIEGDERIGARIYLYRGGSFRVHPYLHPDPSVPHTTLSLVGRWFTALGYGGHNWRYRAVLGSLESIPWSASTRRKAIKRCMCWIDGQIPADDP